MKHYSENVKRAFLTAAVKAKFQGKKSAEIFALAKAQGYKGSEQGIHQMIRKCQRAFWAVKPVSEADDYYWHEPHEKTGQLAEFVVLKEGVIYKVIIGIEELTSPVGENAIWGPLPPPLKPIPKNVDESWFPPESEKPYLAPLSYLVKNELITKRYAKSAKIRMESEFRAGKFYREHDSELGLIEVPSEDPYRLFDKLIPKEEVPAPELPEVQKQWIESAKGKKLSGGYVAAQIKHKYKKASKRVLALHASAHSRVLEQINRMIEQAVKERLRAAIEVLKAHLPQ